MLINCADCGEPTERKKVTGTVRCPKCFRKHLLAYHRTYHRKHYAENREAHSAYYRWWNANRRELNNAAAKKVKASARKCVFTASQLMRLPAEKWDEVFSRPGFALSQSGKTTMPYGKVSSWHYLMARN